MDVAGAADRFSGIDGLDWTIGMLRSASLGSTVGWKFWILVMGCVCAQADALEQGSNTMNEEMFKARTKQFALKVIELVIEMPRSLTGDVLARQLLRSGTSVGSNYRAACRSRSSGDMLYKLGIVNEEGDESLFWLELLKESGLVPAERLEWLMGEGDELVAMTVASINTLRRNTTQDSGPSNRPIQSINSTKRPKASNPIQNLKSKI
jgi:four helix bundle protein